MADQPVLIFRDPGTWNAREIARRNRADAGRPLSPVMKTAATAIELAHAGDAPEERFSGAPEPSD